MSDESSPCLIYLATAPFEIVEAVLESHRVRARRRLDRLEGHQFITLCTITGLACVAGALAMRSEPVLLVGFAVNLACCVVALARWARAGHRVDVAMKAWDDVIAAAKARRGRCAS